MTVVVTDNCQLCRFTECVSVCPVSCFHADDSMVYIDPNVCIDCSACVSKCPVSAIFDAFDLPEDKHAWIQINADRAPRLPQITQKQTPLPTAEQRKNELGF